MLFGGDEQQQNKLDVSIQLQLWRATEFNQTMDCTSNRRQRSTQNNSSLAFLVLSTTRTLVVIGARGKLTVVLVQYRLRH